jgi:hypothetical protein
MLKSSQGHRHHADEVKLTKSMVHEQYCRVDWNGTGASRPRSGSARDFVNFRKKKHASRAHGAAARV